MRVELYELLQRRRIVHPTTITAFEAAEDGLRMSVSGYAWWLGREDYDIRRTITFTFEDIMEGFTYLPVIRSADNEALEDFEVGLLDDYAWARPATFAIYCNAPLGKPMRLYAKVHDFLHVANAARGPEDFLNACDSLAQFVEVTARRSYLLARGPEVIRRLICEELESQDVPFTVLDQDARAATGLLVRLDGAAFTCERATAEFDDV